jgi:peptidoglycan/LPS O-acetylase OafA/YrhL
VHRLRRLAATLIAQIEAIRGLATAGIFLFHLWSVLPDGAPTAALAQLFSQGHLGVVVFNLITGLVLALPHFGPSARSFSAYRAFLSQRMRRIFPGYAIALTLWSALALVLSSHPRKELGIQYLVHLAGLHTLSSRTFFGIVPAYWWIGLVLQVYFVFPLLLRAYRRFAPGPLTFTLCATCWGAWALIAHIGRSRPGSSLALVNYIGYFNLPYRLPEFATGIWLASRIRERPLGTDGEVGSEPSFLLLGLTSATAIALWILSRVFPSIASQLEADPLRHIYHVAICLAIFAALFSLRIMARIGRTPMAQRIGELSFGVYLMHQPLLGYAREFLIDSGMAPKTQFALLLAFCGSSSLLAARILEQLTARLGAARGNAKSAARPGS